MAVNLRLPAKAPIGSVCTRSSPVVLHRTPVVLARADGPRVTREFKEREDGSLEQVQQSQDASKPQSSQQPLYVDDAAQPPKRKQDNLSKDMKTKLRQEYYGLGGGENKGHLPNPRRTPLVAILTVEERGTETSAPSTSQPPAQPVRSSKWKIDENELLKSTWEHRFWTLAPMAAMAATGVQALTHAHNAGDWAEIAAALAVSYVLSDLGTGIYHWGVDNYGGAETPVFGRQIAAFQGHHQRPWTITEREFCNNVHQVFKPAFAPASLFLLASPWTSPTWNAFISSFIFLVCMSQQFHAWSHMKKSELPGPVIALQDAGVLISRKMHGAHHRAPFEGNYCIVSGLWNPLLDSTLFFRTLERVIHERTGVEPRCWHDPEHGWEELQRPESTA